MVRRLGPEALAGRAVFAPRLQRNRCAASQEGGRNRDRSEASPQLCAQDHPFAPRTLQNHRARAARALRCLECSHHGKSHTVLKGVRPLPASCLRGRGLDGRANARAQEIL